MKAGNGILAIATMVAVLTAAPAYAQVAGVGGGGDTSDTSDGGADVAPIPTSIALLATDRLPPIARSWLVHGGNSQVLGASLAGRVVIRPTDDGQLALTSSHPGRAHFEAVGPLEPNADGLYVFRTTVHYKKGMLGGLLNFEGAKPLNVELQFRLDRERFELDGETFVDGERVARPKLRRHKRALVAYSRVRYHERFYMFRHRLWTANYYQSRGYRVVQRQIPRVELLIELLEEAGKNNDPYDRVVMMGHGGNDGVVFGYGFDDGDLKGSRQVAPNENPHLWPRFVEAVKVGTTPNAILLASGCYTANGKHVTGLAEQTGRTVVGTTELTSVHRTQPHAKAMEGEGEFLQEMMVARGDKVFMVKEDGRLSDDPAEVREVVPKPPVNIPDKVERGRMVYTYNGGWIDIGHAGFLSQNSGQKMLITKVLNETGTSISDTHYKLSYSQGMGPSWLSGNWFTTVKRDYVIKKGLGRDEKLQVALAIFMEVSEAFESHQGNLWGVRPITKSSFSEDDLVSNVIGFYAAVHGLSKEDVMEMLDPATKEDSARLWNLTGGPGKNKAWVPVDHNHLLGRPPMEFPEVFTSITPATIGGDLVKRYEPAAETTSGPYGP